MISQEAYQFHLKSITVNPESHKYLLAVSGGADSMCMLNLFLTYIPKQIAVAHCNFQLRGKESKMDESLVEQYCFKNQITFYKKSFDTLKESKNTGKGIQEIARTLRYEWFNQLAKQHGYDYIVTAHHADDNAETVLLNIIRGAGLNGIGGILPLSENKLRPLLIFTKKEILEFVYQNQIPFRDDISNNESKYNRNYLRNEIIPKLQKINPAFVKHANELAEHSQDALQLIQHCIIRFIDQYCEVNNNGITIPINEVSETGNLKTYLYYLLSPYGFNRTTIHEIIPALSAQNGKQFESENYEMVLDRKDIVVKRKNIESFHTTNFELPFQFTYHLKQYELAIIPYTKEKAPSFSSHTLYLDAATIDLKNLELRNWQQGDKFTPLGMQQQKLVSDFFIDKKINRLDKKKILLLLSDKKIVAVIPYQINNTNKITADTTSVLKISCT